MKRLRRLCKLNNKGAGVVAVIVAIALVSILVSVVLSTSYANFKMKQTNFKAKNNFYSAEQALDEIKIGLQGYVSEALSAAYFEVISQYSDVATNDEKNELMEHEFYTQLWSRLEDPIPSLPAHSRYKVSLLYSFVSEPWNDSDGVGALVSSVKPEMVTYEKQGIVLKDLEVYYRDASDYSTFITTDIRLVCPIIQFGSSSVLPDIMDYAIIADMGMEISSLGDATNTINGQIYADYITAGAENGHKLTMIFDNVDADSVFNVVTRRNMNFRNADVTFPDGGSVWAETVKVDSSSVLFRGMTYLGNDLSLDGRNPSATINGTFIGYGNSTSNSEKSSSIVINGKNSVLDLSGSDIISLAGHAFVGTGKAHTDNFVDERKGTAKSGNVLTGESIAVKSDQLLYLLPGDAVGVNSETGYSRYSKNPLTAEEYKSLVVNSDPEDKTTYKDVNENYLFFVDEKGNEKRFSYFANDVIKVFIPIGNTTMVYYYISFKDDKKANEFFSYFYDANSKKYNNYVSFYTDSIKIPDSTNLIKFKTAGNILTAVDDAGSFDVELIENTVAGGSSEFESSSELYLKQKMALCTKLVTSFYDFDLADLEKCNDYTKYVMFDNLVKKEDLNKYLFEEGVNIDVFTVPGATETEPPIWKAILTNQPYVYKGELGPTGDKEVNLIISSSDVTISADFTGLIICGGKLTVKPGVTITKSSDLSKKALRLQKKVDENIISPFSFLRDGEDIVNAEDSPVFGSSLTLSDLVIYENWSKE